MSTLVHILRPLAGLAVVYTVYLIVSSVLTSRRNAAKARQLNCEEPPAQKNRLPLGIDVLWDMNAAGEEKRFPTFFTSLFREYGNTYSFKIFGAKGFRTEDPKNIQAILATKFNDFDLGEQRRNSFWPTLGAGIFTSDGDAWKHSRALLRPQFTRDQISDLDLEEDHVQKLMRVLDSKKMSDGWMEVDLSPMFFRLTLDSATEFLIGDSTNTQLAELPEYKAKAGVNPATKFGTDFDTALGGLATRGQLFNLYFLFNTKEFRKANREIHNFIDKYVHRALTQWRGGKRQEEGGKYTFLDALVSETQDPIRLRCELLHILLAGRDTTASLLGWVFHHLSRDPVRYQKLRTAVINDFGTYDAPQSELSFAKLKDCKYLRYSLDEALRLNPVVPVNSRASNKDTTMPRGGGPDGNSPVFVPKGTEVNYSVHAMHRRKDLWGPDAEEFVPERWEGRKPGWEYLPFNGGPRICIGQQFALTEASYVTVRMLQRFDKMESLMPRDEPVRDTMTLTNSIANGVKVRLHVADNR